MAGRVEKGRKKKQVGRETEDRKGKVRFNLSSEQKPSMRKALGQSPG